MKKLKFTPAPWSYYAEASGFNFGISANGRHVADLSHNANIPTKEKEANAVLIASAPEMLNALIEAQNELEVWDSSAKGTDPDTARALRIVRKAIKKATSLKRKNSHVHKI